MLYWVFKWIAGIALRWYYRDIRVVGAERIPQAGAAILAVNHPNALVDALVAGYVAPRRLRLTGKATLFESPMLAALLRAVGVVPLRRASDELKKRQRNAASPVAVARNDEAFAELSDVLGSGGAMLIFPEGKSHSEPSIAPLKTGVARIALEARDVRGVRGLKIVPIGLVFERKELPRSRVLVQIGEPISLDRFENPDGARGPAENLTALLDQRLREVTLNFESQAHAARVLEVADLMAGVTAPLQVLGRADPELATVLDVVRRIEQARIALETRPELGSGLGTRVEQFLARIDEYAHELRRHRLAATDVRIETDLRSGARFALREGAIVLLAGPAAAWGRINHFIPLRAARAIAVSGATGRDQPAMRTMISGLILVLAAYVVQSAAVAWAAGPFFATAYLITLPFFATWDLQLTDRAERAAGRVHAYRLFRGDPSLQTKLVQAADWLRVEAEEIERALNSPDRAGTGRAGPNAMLDDVYQYVDP